MLLLSLLNVSDVHSPKWLTFALVKSFYFYVCRTVGKDISQTDLFSVTYKILLMFEMDGTTILRSFQDLKTLLHYTTSGSLHTSMISFCNKLPKEINWVKLNDMICPWQLEWYQHTHRLQTQNTDGRNKSCHKLISCPWNHCWSQVSPPLSFQSPDTMRGAENEIRLHCAVGRNTIRKLWLNGGWAGKWVIHLSSRNFIHKPAFAIIFTPSPQSLDWQLESLWIRLLIFKTGNRHV